MEKIKNAFSEKLEPLVSKIGELTKLQRYLIYGGTLVLITVVYVYALYLPKYEEKSRLEENLTKVEEQLKTTKGKAMQLESLQKKMEEARVQFEIVKKTLPEKKDIPSLLSSISQSGRDSGLEFFLFQPKKELSKGFYAEIPVAMKMQGNYHNLAIFFARVADMSRIVNVRDIKITGGASTLDTACTAVTYRFIDAESAPKQAPTKKGRRRK
ncbi:MAG: type 4a pilus biogenesis protein PilO [Thermodesulfobacteriota bacterium]